MVFRRNVFVLAGILVASLAQASQLSKFPAVPSSFPAVPSSWMNKISDVKDTVVSYVPNNAKDMLFYLMAAKFAVEVTRSTKSFVVQKLAYALALDRDAEIANSSVSSLNSSSVPTVRLNCFVKFMAKVAVVFGIKASVASVPARDSKASDSKDNVEKMNIDSTIAQR